jgi:hypothetical protein
MSKEPRYLLQINELSKAYPVAVLAKLLGKTERAIQYWTAEEDRKTPGPQTQSRINELFTKHKKGENLNVYEDVNLVAAINRIEDWRVRVNATLKVLRDELAPLIAVSSGRSISSVLNQMEKDIDAEIQSQKLLLKKAG